MHDPEEAEDPVDPRLRSLFQESGEAFERAGPWDGPPAFMVGGMAVPTAAEMADQYVRAAGLLVDAIARGDCEDYLLPNPVLYLYRHAIELRLKWLLGGAARTHDLRGLMGEISTAAAAGRLAAPPAWVGERLAEFARMDPGSTSFRYGPSRKAADGADDPLAGDSFVDVRHLRAVMEAAYAALRGTEGRLGAPWA